ncbi:MAG: dihydrodipicolinate synthase family protein [Spirochaetales bacterium]
MSIKPLTSIRGVIPALITCFDEHGEFDPKRQRAVVRFLLSKKVDGLYVTGSTGEFFLLSTEERRHILELVLDEVAGQVPVIAHVGAVSTKASAELARHAQASGADAVSSVPPYYWKFTNDEIVDYYQRVSEATEIPMVAYNIALSGLFGFDLIRRLAALPNVKGLKYTAPSHFEIGRIKTEVGRDFVVYSGADEMAFSGLSVGADGIIGSFYNVIPEVFQRLYAAVGRGALDEARQLQEQANGVIFRALEHNLLPAVKALLLGAGIDAGPCRHPLLPLSQAAASTLRASVKKWRDDQNLRGVAALDGL